MNRLYIQTSMGRSRVAIMSTISKIIIKKYNHVVVQGSRWLCDGYTMATYAMIRRWLGDGCAMI